MKQRTTDQDLADAFNEHREQAGKAREKRREDAAAEWERVKHGLVRGRGTLADIEKLAAVFDDLPDDAQARAAHILSNRSMLAGRIRDKAERPALFQKNEAWFKEHQEELDAGHKKITAEAEYRRGLTVVTPDYDAQIKTRVREHPDYYHDMKHLWHTAAELKAMQEYRAAHSPARGDDDVPDYPSHRPSNVIGPTRKAGPGRLDDPAGLDKLLQIYGKTEEAVAAETAKSNREARIREIQHTAKWREEQVAKLPAARERVALLKRIAEEATLAGRTPDRVALREAEDEVARLEGLAGELEDLRSENPGAFSEDGTGELATRAVQMNTIGVVSARGGTPWSAGPVATPA